MEQNESKQETAQCEAFGCSVQFEDENYCHVPKWGLTVCQKCRNDLYSQETYFCSQDLKNADKEIQRLLFMLLTTKQKYIEITGKMKVDQQHVRIVDSQIQQAQGYLKKIEGQDDISALGEVLSNTRDIKQQFESSFPVKIIKDILFKQWLDTTSAPVHPQASLQPIPTTLSTPDPAPSSQPAPAPSSQPAPAPSSQPAPAPSSQPAPDPTDFLKRSFQQYFTLKSSPAQSPPTCLPLSLPADSCITLNFELPYSSLAHLLAQTVGKEAYPDPFNITEVMLPPLRALALANVPGPIPDLGRFCDKTVKGPLQAFYWNYPALEKYWTEKVTFDGISNSI